MRCDDCREAISAGLDGEQLLGEAAAVAAHLEGCLRCRRFTDNAARVTRLTRTTIAEPTPDLVPAVVAAAPRPRRRIGGGAVRLALGAVGLAQFALAVAGLLGGGGHHGEVELAGASTAHLANESSAWNLAVAVGFLWAATGTTRLAGLVPVLAAFVGTLAVVSVVDAVSARVETDRLLAHGLVVLGFLLLLLLRRIGGNSGGAGQRRSTSGPPTVDRSVPPLTPRFDDRDDGDGDNGDGLAPTAVHRAA